MAQPLHVLILEDSYSDAELVHLELLRAGFTLNWQHVQSKEAFLNSLTVEPDVILADFNLPQFTGIEALQSVRQRGWDTPFILVSGTIGEDLAILAIKEGANDFLLKDRLTRLGHAIHAALEQKRLRQAERAALQRLQTSEARFRAIFERAAVGMAEIALDGTILQVNPAFCEITGYQAAELVQTPWFNLVSAPGRAASQALWEPVFAGAQESCLVETSWVRRDEQVIEVKSTFSLVRTPAVQPDYGIVAIDDMTARKAAERGLEKSLQDQSRLADLLASILNSLPAHIALLDKEGTIVTVNEKWKRFALENQLDQPDYGIGCNYIGVCETASVDHDPANGYRVADGIRQVLSGTQKEFTFEYPCPAPEQERWFKLIISPLCNSLDRETVEGAVTMHVDITDRMLVEAALRTSEERNRDLVENATDIIFTRKLDDTLLSINKIAETLTGYNRSEMLGLPFDHLLAPEFRALAHRKLKEQETETSLPTLFEAELVCKNGRRQPVEISSRLVFEGDRPVATQGIARDVSERRKLEEQLRQAQKMEAIGRLAGGISHDFNNLLTAILGYSEILLLRLQDERLRSKVEEIKKAGNQAAALVRQLLTFSRRDTRKPRSLNLNQVVRETQGILTRTIGEDIELVLHLQAELDPTYIDPTQVNQIIMNLVVNARDAMPTGGRLTIETRNFEVDATFAAAHPGATPGPHVKLSVSDTGYGMSDEIRSQIFEPFFTTKEHGKGTGLGLPIVYGIVRQSDGFLLVESQPGQGTGVHIYLPSTTFRLETTPLPGLSVELPRGTETILLVEDDAMVRQLAEEVLTLCGYQVLLATDGQEALLVVNDYQAPIDMLLTDVIMPKMNGPELALQVRTLFPDMLVVFMSGYTDRLLSQPMLEDQEIALIQKPFTPLILAQRVRTELNAKGKKG
ncbi:MAG: PAS domain S-box protein [Blastocatellia bacterium]|nr:PAS domain S-box protein [Blastocatellia bacterium]